VIGFPSFGALTRPEPPPRTAAIARLRLVRVAAARGSDGVIVPLAPPPAAFQAGSALPRA
jgi:hypothetical protein